MKKMILQQVMGIVIQELRDNGQWGTSHIYQSTLNAFSAFNEYRDQPINKLTASLLKRFELYLRQQKCSWNTVSTYMKSLRATYNRAVDRGWAKYSPRLFEHVYTGTRTDKKRTLDVSEIGRLVRDAESKLLKAVLTSNMQKTEAFFVLMFLTRGLPFVDLAYMHKQDLQGNVLSYRRQKTGRYIRVTLSEEALQLIHLVENKDENSPYLFPILRSEEGTEAAYREYQAALRSFNHRLAALGKKWGIESISSYSARHTWATMAYYCEIHPGIISEAMGHSSITVTETYLKPFHDKRIDEANQKVISFAKGDGTLK